MTMIFWKREPSNPKHQVHQFLEMLKTNFELDIRKRDVVMKDMHFYQVDMFWYGSVKHMQKTMEDLDNNRGSKLGIIKNSTLYEYRISVCALWITLMTTFFERLNR